MPPGIDLPARPHRRKGRAARQGHGIRAPGEDDRAQPSAAHREHGNVEATISRSPDAFPPLLKDDPRCQPLNEISVERCLFTFAFIAILVAASSSMSAGARSSRQQNAADAAALAGPVLTIGCNPTAPVTDPPRLQTIPGRRVSNVVVDQDLRARSPSWSPATSGAQGTGFFGDSRHRTVFGGREGESPVGVLAVGQPAGASRTPGIPPSTLCVAIHISGIVATSATASDVSRTRPRARAGDCRHGAQTGAGCPTAPRRCPVGATTTGQRHQTCSGAESSFRSIRGALAKLALHGPSTHRGRGRGRRNIRRRRNELACATTQPPSKTAASAPGTAPSRLYRPPIWSSALASSPSVI